MQLDPSKVEFRANPRLMGSAFELIVVHHDKSIATQLLDEGVAEIKRIEDLLSEFIPDSITSLINKYAGIRPIVVPSEVFQLLQRCQQISELTQGAFDITVGPLKKIYHFKNKDFQFPPAQLIESTLEMVGYTNLILNVADQSVFLLKKNMRISFAAIGKGYAADQVKKLWQSKSLESGVINASGDLTSFGHRADGSPWNLAIVHPDNKEAINYQLPVNNASIATSGDYEQFFTFKGKRYSHSIHPISGRPTSGIKSVSVFSPSAELSDALATAIFIMGVPTGLHFINQLPITHCIIIDEHNQTHFSESIELKTKPKLVQAEKIKQPIKTNQLRSVMASFCFFGILLLSSCATVPNYERIYLNDSEMQMGQTVASGVENYIHTIREGATPAGGAKTSGGCGCN